MTTTRRTPHALAILGLLEDGPLHPYRMQQLFIQFGKDQVVNVGQRANLYKVIARLVDAGLIRVRETSRDSLYPERTTYELTDAGRRVRQDWLTEILSEARNEFPEFPVALTFLPLMDPDEVAARLRSRREGLAKRLEERDALIASVGVELPPVTMLETGYLHALLEAEIAWLDQVVAAIGKGSLHWTLEQNREVAAKIDHGG